MKKAEFRNYSASEIKYVIDEWVHNQRYREMLQLALVDGLTYREIADRFYCSEVSVVKVFNTYGNALLYRLEESRQ